MENQKYNGWTNYATWRINLEIFDYSSLEDIGADKDWTASELSDYLQDYVYNILEEEAKGLALNYAHAFISDVNWYEIAEHLVEAE